ncbi:hypothetical protein ABK040_014200 [Willaertia magna]
MGQILEISKTSSAELIVELPTQSPKEMQDNVISKLGTNHPLLGANNAPNSTTTVAPTSNNIVTKIGDVK